MERWVVRRLRGAIWEAEIAMKQANTARRMEGEGAGLGVGRFRCGHKNSD